MSTGFCQAAKINVSSSHVVLLWKFKTGAWLFLPLIVTLNFCVVPAIENPVTK